VCPDPAFTGSKGLLEIKEDWPGADFDVADTARRCFHPDIGLAHLGP
jgi:hypothetical protein